jgi:hypothetical protein
MKSIVVRLLGLSLLALPVAGVAGGPSTLVPSSEKIAGHSQADWSRTWWQWAESFADYESPIADKKGSRCQLKQTGAVWFLAGTYGTRRTIRTCTVPAGKYLFFPLINYVVFPRSGYSLTCAQATDTAADVTEDVSSLVLDVDGKVFKNLEAHRQPTKGCFDLAAQAGGGMTPAAANGYYIMLRPLSRGTHTLNFGGILPGMSQAVTYTLHVE